VVPVVLLTPAGRKDRMPVVVGLAQGGKAGFLKERAEQVRQLVQGGAIVVLPDVRGTGETRAGSDRGYRSEDANLSVHEQLFGETLLGQRLRDLRSVLVYLRGRPDVDVRRLALWGDSFAPPNPPETNFQVPHGAEPWPREAEPLGGLLALFGALFEEDVRAVSVSGGLAGYHDVLTHFAVLIPHADTVPGALTAGDLADVAASLAPRPLWLGALVDQRNQPRAVAEARKEYEPAVRSYAARPEALRFEDTRSSAVSWLLGQLKD
jgi:hypothetical protein